MEKWNSMAFKEIRGLAFDMLKRSADKERRIKIKDSGAYFTIQVKIKVVAEEFRHALDRVNKKSSHYLEP